VVVVSSVLTEASPFSFFTIVASPWESAGAEDEVGAGVQATPETEMIMSRETTKARP
jgi:hypothetical protein